MRKGCLPVPLSLINSPIVMLLLLNCTAADLLLPYRLIQCGYMPIQRWAYSLSFAFLIRWTRPYIRSFHLRALLVYGSTPSIPNIYIPPLMLCGTQYRVVGCGPPLWCAEWEVRVGSVRVRMTFLWMSDPIFLLDYWRVNNSANDFSYCSFLSTKQIITESLWVSIQK